MNTMLTIQDEPRKNGDDQLAGLPLTTVAWRVLRAGHDLRRREEKSLKKALPPLVGAVMKLRAAGRQCIGGKEKTSAPPCRQQARNLETILDRLGVSIIAPAGRPYTTALMQYLDNIAQVSRVGIAGPMVEEVVEPAVLYRGEILRMGKAVIAVPLDMGALPGGQE